MIHPFMPAHVLIALCVGVSIVAGCASYQFTTLTLYESPDAFVRLEVDRTLQQTTGHSHPADLSTERMAAVLRGITVEEPMTRLPLYDDLSQPRRHAAFTEKDIALFAPLLALAVKKATPEELVTFYFSRLISGTSREITSGGLFVKGDELHVILANYRSPTHYTADIGVADTADDRLVPLRAIAPQRGQLDFEPRSAKREVTDAVMDKILRPDKRELIVLYKSLKPLPASSSNH